MPSSTNRLLLLLATLAAAGCAELRIIGEGYPHQRLDQTLGGQKLYETSR